MSHGTPNGKREIIDGRLRVHYYGYWIKSYEVPADTLLAKKHLIEALTRRLFNHCEAGINVPGRRLDDARRAFDLEGDPQRRRVKGAMLAGALFNREALELGKLVLHRSGEEGLDELWGEPFKAFAFPIESFYESRYIKIAQSMQAIEAIRDELVAAISRIDMFGGATPLVSDFARAATIKCETLRTDAEIFEIWTSFVVSAERLTRFTPRVSADAPASDQRRAAQGKQLILDGTALISYVTRARVPMPKSAQDFTERCRQFRGTHAEAERRSVA